MCPCPSHPHSPALCTHAPFRSSTPKIADCIRPPKPHVCFTMLPTVHSAWPRRPHPLMRSVEQDGRSASGKRGEEGGSGDWRQQRIEKGTWRGMREPGLQTGCYATLRRKALGASSFTCSRASSTARSSSAVSAPPWASASSPWACHRNGRGAEAKGMVPIATRNEEGHRVGRRRCCLLPRPAGLPKHYVRPQASAVGHGISFCGGIFSPRGHHAWRPSRQGRSRPRRPENPFSSCSSNTGELS